MSRRTTLPPTARQLFVTFRRADPDGANDPLSAMAVFDYAQEFLGVTDPDSLVFRKLQGFAEKPDLDTFAMAVTASEQAGLLSRGWADLLCAWRTVQSLARYVKTALRRVFPLRDFSVTSWEESPVRQGLDVHTPGDVHSLVPVMISRRLDQAFAHCSRTDASFDPLRVILFDQTAGDGGGVDYVRSQSRFVVCNVREHWLIPEEDS